MPSEQDLETMSTHPKQQSSQRSRPKPWGTIGLLVALIIVTAVSAYNYFYTPVIDSPWFQINVPEQTASPEATSEAEPSLQIELSAREKILQMIVAPITVKSPIDATPSATSTVVSSESRAWLQANKPGSVLLFGSSISSQSAQAVEIELRKLYANAVFQPLTAVDHEGGTVTRLTGSGFTTLGSWGQQCEMDRQELEDLLSQTAGELRAVGIDIVLAPVVDRAVAGSPLRTRACSDNPDIIVDRSILYISTFAENGILPVIKHFPGIGESTTDLHFAFDQLVVSPLDVLIYQTILDEYPNIGVMISHIGVLNQHPEIPCSLSVDCVNELKSVYPDALLFSDALEMTAASHPATSSAQPKDLSTIAVEAVLAGNDVLVFGADTDYESLDIVVASLESAYQNSASFSARVDQSVEKIVEYKQSR